MGWVSLMIKGIDVASYQAEDYEIGDNSFVVVKATEGTGYVNPKYEAQVKRARDSALVVGHYHFVNGNRSMRQQVDYFLSEGMMRQGEFLVLDWEDPDVDNAEKDDFLKYLKSKTDKKVLLYCNKDYWKNRDHTNFAGDGLWIADPDSPAGKPDVEHPWLIHQYSSAGGTDRNVANFASRADMAAWAGKRIPKPAPVYAPYPGSSFFKLGRKSPVVTAMGKRLVANGYKGYKRGPSPEFTRADLVAYRWWQLKLGYRGADADGYPGPDSWKKLRVPKS